MKDRYSRFIRVVGIGIAVMPLYFWGINVLLYISFSTVFLAFGIIVNFYHKRLTISRESARITVEKRILGLTLSKFVIEVPLTPIFYLEREADQSGGEVSVPHYLIRVQSGNHTSRIDLLGGEREANKIFCTLKSAFV